jgi:hypothetical protein
LNVDVADLRDDSRQDCRADQSAQYSATVTFPAAGST